MRLEVQALTGCVGREPNAQRVLPKVGVEPTLDLLAVRAAGKAVDHLDALVGAVGSLDRVFEDRLQVALRALAILREDQNAAVIPRGDCALHLAAEWWHSGAHALAYPVHQTPPFCVGSVAGCLDSCLLPIEKWLVAA